MISLIGFNGAALVGVRRGGAAWMPSSTSGSFNGAALVGVRREPDGPHSRGHRKASTEPHSLECGEARPFCR